MNTGHMFIRFSEARFREEVEDYINNEEVYVTCNVTGSNRSLRCRPALRDLGGKYYNEDGCILVRTRYFEDCFRVMEM